MIYAGDEIADDYTTSPSEYTGIAVICQFCGSPLAIDDDGCCEECGEEIPDGDYLDDEPRESLFEEQFENQSLYGGDDGHLDSYGEDY